jgi:Uma2 family endonuclease
MAQRVLTPERADERLTMTYQEFLEWVDEDTHGEWVDGEVIVFMPPKVRHAQILGYLFNLLSYVVRKRGDGQVLTAPFEMRLSMIPSSREPDIAYIASAHHDRIRDGRLDGPADLVVEVLSPESVTRDRRDKLREYAVAGIPEYWIVEGREGRSGVTMLRLHEEGYYVEISPDEDGLIRSQVLSGLWIDPAWFDQDDLPDPFSLADQMLQVRSNQ